MPNSIEFAKKYTGILDEVYQRAAVSNCLNSGGNMVRAGRNAKEILIPKIEVTGLGDYTRNVGYKTGSITWTYETHTFAYDRAIRLFADVMDVEEAGIIDCFVQAGAELQRTQVAPEGDAYTFSEIASTEGVTTKTEDLSSATAEQLLASLRTVTSAMDEKQVSMGSRYLFITPTLNGVTGPTHRQHLTSATFAADMATFSYLNLNYLFYSCTNLASVGGLGNLSGVRSMRYTFSSCAFATIDFRGFDPSTLTDLFYTFSGCSRLTTILADASWALPTSGITGSQCFYSCSTSLVGGNGTTWASNKTAYTYFRIDTASTPGYITIA